MGISDNLFKWLEKYKKNNDNKKTSYTNISIGEPKISYNIPDEKYNIFLKKYSDAIYQNAKLYFVEKPLDPSLIRIDLDFRFKPIEKDDNVSLNRNDYLTEDCILNITKEYFKTLYSIFELKSNEIKAIVMLKDNLIKEKNIIKDGIHIIFDLVTSNNTQLFIREKILEKANIVFKGIYSINNYNDIVDKAVICSNGWQMYGSRKYGQEAYQIVYTLYYNKKDEDIENCDSDDENENEEDDYEDERKLTFIKNWSAKLSMRQQKFKEIKIKKEYINIINEYINKLKPNYEKNKKYIDNLYLIEIRNNLNNRVDEEKLDLVKKIVYQCLNPDRMDDYGNWIQLGFILRNIDERLLDLWDDFSKNSNKYKENACSKKWDTMKDDRLGLGTLIYWAKIDNPEKYEELLNKSLIKYAEKAIENPTHYDVANLVYKKYGDELKLVRGNIWYIYDRFLHRYDTMIDGLDLSSKLSTDIHEILLSRSKEWADKAMKFDLDAPERASLTTKCDKAQKLMKDCRMTSFKESVIKECKHFFLHKYFDDELNEIPHLIGFLNGVYDIKKGIEYKDDVTDMGFREGSPEDYITFSCKQLYKKYDKNDPTVLEINDFLKKVIPNDNIRKYLMTQFALALDGSFRQEKFFILAGKAGSGSNGKSTLINLIEKSLGDYFGILNVSYITQKRATSNSANPEIIKTKGKRFICMSEPNDGDKLNVGKLKEMTGGDSLSCRGLYKDQVEFKPQFTVFLTCNYVPEVTSNDEGTWRRIKLIEFISKFSENPDYTKPNEYLIDRKLSDKINSHEWTSTFISMLINIRINIPDINNIEEPQEIKDATKKYAREQDLVAQFINDRIIKDINIKDLLSIQTIYTEYKIWFKSNTANNKAPLSRSNFETQLSRNELFEEKNKVSKKTGNYWKYLKIVIEEDNNDEDSNII
jgi:P4 family phage/plasmid primase-like protien